MKIPLERPIVFLDFETTGLSRENDKIVEYCLIKLFKDGSRRSINGLVNPQIPIPKESSAIHGLDDNNVKDAPPFRQVAQRILDFIQGCDIAGFGSNNFDIPLLYNELLRCGITWNYSATLFIDAGNLYKVQQRRDLTAALYYYCGVDHVDAHSAEADVNATIDVFLSQCQEEGMPETIEEIALMSNYGKKILDLSGKFTFNDSNDIIFNFGPHRGNKAADHIDFVSWMQHKDFAPDTLKICNQLVERSYQNQPL